MDAGYHTHPLISLNRLESVTSLLVLSIQYTWRRPTANWPAGAIEGIRIDVWAEAIAGARPHTMKKNPIRISSLTQHLPKEFE
jgi:hypothetical protein